jgi:basic membrane protein A
MIAALKKLSGEQGFPMRAIYAQDPSTYQAIFQELAESGAAVIASTFNEVAEPFKALAPKYPNTKWIQIYGDPFEPAIPNVATVSYDYYVGCYLSGAFGARMSKSGKIGYIGGVSLPSINADLNAIKAAAADHGAGVTVTGAFVGSFQDPVKGHEIASQMFQSGIDFIQTDSAASDTGIIEAASEAPDRVISAGSPAQIKLGPATVASIVSLDFGASLVEQVKRALSPNFTGGHVATGLGTGVIDFSLSSEWLKSAAPDLVDKAQKVWPEIEKIRADIVSGKLTVPFKTVI